MRLFKNIAWGFLVGVIAGAAVILSGAQGESWQLVPFFVSFAVTIFANFKFGIK